MPLIADDRAHGMTFPLSIQLGGAEADGGIVQGGGVDTAAGLTESLDRPRQILHTGDGHGEQRAHSGTEGLGVVEIGAIGAHDEAANPQGSGASDDGAHVEGISDRLQKEDGGVLAGIHFIFLIYYN